VGECYLAEGEMTNADYTEYVRVIGALLRLPRYAKAAFPGAPRRLDIDTAETTWLTYREQSCRAMIYQWGRHTRPSQLPEMPAHGDLGSYE
jgi:hypothetical protein